MRILVCGSRHFNDYALMREVLFQEYYLEDVLIHGDARGADRLAERVLRDTYTPEALVDKIEKYPADWNTHGKAAGPIRNSQMLTEGKPDIVVAFLAPSSKGTRDMISQAEKAGVPVKIIHIADEEASIKP